MALRFTQEEIEQEISDRLPHGMRREIARISGLGESYLKRQLNPHDEQPSCFFKALQIVCAADQLDPAMGEDLWAAIEHFRELSKRPRRGVKSGEVARDTGVLQKEVAELVMAELEGKSPREKMKELLDVENKLMELKYAIIDADQVEEYAN